METKKNRKKELPFTEIRREAQEEADEKNRISKELAKEYDLMNQDLNISFCRITLRDARASLKKRLGTKKYKELMKHFWVYRYSDGSTEVHVNKCEQFPGGYFQTLQRTDNMYHAKADGLTHIERVIFKED